MSHRGTKPPGSCRWFLRHRQRLSDFSIPSLRTHARGFRKRSRFRRRSGWQARRCARARDSSISILLGNVNLLKLSVFPGSEKKRRFIELTILKNFCQTEKALNAGKKNGFPLQTHQHSAVGLAVSGTLWASVPLSSYKSLIPRFLSSFFAHYGDILPFVIL